MAKQLNVIIADDSAEFGQKCAKILRGYGMEVELCEKDGYKIINTVQKQKVDIVVADVFMAGVDILGVLNSKCTTDFLIAEFSDKHLAGGYLAINKSTIEQFLFPQNVSTEIQQQIAHIAKSIHLAKKEDPKSNTATLESQIDSIVSRLHNIR